MFKICTLACVPPHSAPQFKTYAVLPSVLKTAFTGRSNPATAVVTGLPLFISAGEHVNRSGDAAGRKVHHHHRTGRCSVQRSRWDRCVTRAEHWDDHAGSGPGKLNSAGQRLFRSVDYVDLVRRRIKNQQNGPLRTYRHEAGRCTGADSASSQGIKFAVDDDQRAGGRRRGGALRRQNALS
jgi:hypothetical protein